MTKIMKWNPHASWRRPGNATGRFLEDVALVAIFSAFTSVGAGQEAEVDTYVKAQMAAQHIPGVSVAVVREAKQALCKGYGYANVELSAPATDKTVYELQSVGKQFTATAVMLLVEEGKLSLDDAVGKYLTELPASWRAVTIRRLLNHTSDIPDYIHAPGWKETIRLDRTPLELLKPVFPLEVAPGTKWKYSNSDYLVLGLIIEKISGDSYADFLAKRILQPLGMTSTRINSMTDVIANRADGYWWKDGLLKDEYVSPSQKWAAGGVVSSAADLAKWAESLEQATLLKATSLQTMLVPGRLANGAEVPYGFANELDEDHGHKMAGHQGGGLGFNATLLHYPADHLEVVVLCNLRTARSLPMARHIAAIYLPELSDANKQGMEDKAPKTTALLKQIITEVGKGNLDDSLFSAEAREKLVPSIRRAGPHFVGPLGEMRSFTLIERTEDGDGQTLRYRSKFDSMSLIWTFKLNRANKITAMEPRPE